MDQKQNGKENGHNHGNGDQSLASVPSTLAGEAAIEADSIYNMFGDISMPQMFQYTHSTQDPSSLNPLNAPSGVLQNSVGILDIGSPSTGAISQGVIAPAPTDINYSVEPTLSADNNFLPYNPVPQSTLSGVIVPGVDAPDSEKEKKPHTSTLRQPFPKKQRRISSVAAAALTTTSGKPMSTTVIGGVTVPTLHPQASTAMQVQVAAATAAAAAAPLKPKGGCTKTTLKTSEGASENSSLGEVKELSAEEKAQKNRDRNREHARSTRLRKKAYVNKLKELVEGLQTERAEETKKKRVTMQHFSEVRTVRKNVVLSVLKFLVNYENDERKWSTLLEDDFWFKQPVTPYRSFPRIEIHGQCRISRGVNRMINESASMSVMIESIGSRSSRWMHIKRGHFLVNHNITPSVIGQNGQVQHAVSSISPSSGSSDGSGEEGEKSKDEKSKASSGNNSTRDMNGTASEKRRKSSNEYHVYNAPSLPDPKLDSGDGCGSEGTAESQSQAGTDSSSADEDIKQPSATRMKSMNKSSVIPATLATDRPSKEVKSNKSKPPDPLNDRKINPGLPSNIARKGGIVHNIRPQMTKMPGPTSNKATNERLEKAPPIELLPFVGIGKKAAVNPSANNAKDSKTTSISKGSSPLNGSIPKLKSNAPHTVSQSSKSTNESGNDMSFSSNVATASVTSSLIPVFHPNEHDNNINQPPQIRAVFHVNEDDMLLTGDVLMCPFVLRTQDSVYCGALAECIMPGMLRGRFSQRNKLSNLEMVYDAMGFMQQLERASGSEGSPEIIPNSLEMAISPNTDQARVITLAKPPYLIICVNEHWSRLTKYTQMEVEGKELSILNGKRTDANAFIRRGKPMHTFEEVAKGRSACSVNRYEDKFGMEYEEFRCSYPLTNAEGEVTHLLHVCKELSPVAMPVYGINLS